MYKSHGKMIWSLISYYITIRKVKDEELFLFLDSTQGSHEGGSYLSVEPLRLLVQTPVSQR